MCDKSINTYITKKFNGTLVTFQKDNKQIGKIKISIDAKDKVLMLWSWTATKGYGRKILMCLISTLISSKIIQKNFEIIGFIKPLSYVNQNNYNSKYKKLHEIYSKMGFNIDSNGTFSQRTNKLILKNRVPFGNITSSFQ